MLAPDKSLVKTFLENFLASYHSITLSAISLRNSQFFPLDPQPDWMTSLGTNLTSAQESANQFLVFTGPSVVSQVPQFFVNYSNSMQVILANINNAKTPAEAIKQLQWLKNRIADVPPQVQKLFALLNDVTTTFKPYNTNIKAAIQSAYADIKTDQAKVTDISNQISKLMQDISAETVTAEGGMTGVITSGASMSFALLSWSFAVATTLNPALPVIGILVAVGGLTYGAITNAINQSKIAANLESIKVLSGSLLKENQAIGVLQSLTPMLQSVDDSLAGIATAMDVSPIWAAESQKVSDLITTLQNYTGTDFKTIPDIASLPDAAAAWKTLATWSANIQKSITGMGDVGTINLNVPTGVLTVV